MEKVFNELESFDIHEQDSAKQKIAECFAASEYSSTKTSKIQKSSPFSQFFLFFYYNFHSQFYSISIEITCSFNRSYL